MDFRALSHNENLNIHWYQSLKLKTGLPGSDNLFLISGRGDTGIGNE